MATKKTAGKNELQIETSIPPPANASDVQSSYANVIEILSMNHIDVRFAFNEVVVGSEQEISVVRRANIVMSVPAFFSAVQLLNANAENLSKLQQGHADRAQARLTAQIEAGRAEKTSKPEGA